ncbi:MAG: hypothetical protein WEC15_05790 [Flavobacteriales bacterium]
MPTRAYTDHPFSRPDTPSKAQVQAYLEGRLSPEQKQAMERNLELDPLLRDAVDGLRTPDAIAAMAGLENLRPNPLKGRGNGTLYLIASVALLLAVAGIWLVVSPMLDSTRADLAKHDPASEASNNSTQELLLPLDNAEIAAAVEQPEPLRIGHIVEEQPLPLEKTTAPIQRDPGIPTLDRIPTTVPDATPDPARPARPAPAKRSTRMLLFPHDLKLVHPEEMYPYEPGIDPSELNVSAQYADRRTQQADNEAQRTMRYTEYMTKALGEFSRNDHKTCLKSLNFLLEQYPEDVNALFYAGLCSHNLALYEHARTFLHRAATHPIDSFNEEAVWYHALTLERLGDTQAAQESFARIAADQGFYAERAAARLR